MTMQSQMTSQFTMGGGSPSALDETQNTLGLSDMLNTQSGIPGLEDEDSTDEIGELPEGVLSPASRGKGDADRHKDCFLFRF